MNIGDKLIIAINKELKDLVSRYKIDAKVIDLDFEAVKNLYGGVRCATQVYRNILAASPKKKPMKNNNQFELLSNNLEEKLSLN